MKSEAQIIEMVAPRLKSLRQIDTARHRIFEAARRALDQYQWLVTPDFDQEGAVQAAEKLLAAQTGTPLLAARCWFKPMD